MVSADEVLHFEVVSLLTFIVSSFPQYLTFWKSGGAAKEEKVRILKKTDVWLLTQGTRESVRQNLLGDLITQMV